MTKQELIAMFRAEISSLQPNAPKPGNMRVPWTITTSDAARKNGVSVSLIKRRLEGRYGDENHTNTKCSGYIFRIVKED